jgi:hypothetical protein
VLPVVVVETDVDGPTRPAGTTRRHVAVRPARESPQRACSTQRPRSCSPATGTREPWQPTEPIDVLGVAGQYTTLGGLVTPPYDADYWRQRANEARALAEAMTLPVAKREMEYIAAIYERLANRAVGTAGRKSTRERF